MQIHRQSPAKAPYSDAGGTAQLTIEIGIVTRYAGVILGALMINGVLATAPLAILLFPSPVRVEYVAMVMAAATFIVGAGFSVAAAGLYFGTLVVAFGELLTTSIDTALQAGLHGDGREGGRQAWSADSIHLQPQHSGEHHVQP
jgi:hypothetical protein